MKRRSLLMILMAALALLTFDPPVQAQAFNRGLKAFQKGDFRNAKRYLSQGVRKSRDPYQKALMFKLIGVSEYNLGSKRGAASAFSKAIKLDPAIKLTRKETRNRGILKMFANVKKKSVGRGGGRGRGRPSFRAARRGSNRGGASSTSLIENLIPFGYPQYKQGKIITAAVLATGQAAGLFLFFERSNAAKTADEDAFSVITEQDENNSYDEEEFNSYIDANAEFVLAARQESQYGIFLFAGLWAAGIAEAILNPPESEGRRRAAIEKAKTYLSEGETLDDYYISSEPKSFRKNGLQLSPTPNFTGGQLQYTVNF